MGMYSMYLHFFLFGTTFHLSVAREVKSMDPLSELTMVPSEVLNMQQQQRHFRGLSKREQEDSKREEIFSNIWLNNSWGSKESRSGPGSTVKYTTNTRLFLSNFIKKYKIRSVLDAACGAMTWQEYIPGIDTIDFTGMDIVSSAIEKHKVTFKNNKNWRFIQGDITDSKLPDADIIIARDVLFHLPLGEVKKAITNFNSTNAKYLVTTSFEMVDGKENTEIRAGNWHFLYLEKKPFDFPPPMEKVIEEKNTEYTKYLGVWKLPINEKNNNQNNHNVHAVDHAITVGKKSESLY